MEFLRSVVKVIMDNLQTQDVANKAVLNNNKVFVRIMVDQYKLKILC